jgi:DNA-directed RNA polymerase specialized sigma24 family protein
VGSGCQLPFRESLSEGSVLFNEFVTFHQNRRQQIKIARRKTSALSRTGLSSLPFFIIGSPFLVSLVKESSSQIDSLLEPLVQMSGAEEMDVFLSQLIAVHVEPVINGIIRYKLRHNLKSSGAEAEAEDLRQEAIAQLLAELLKLRSDIETHPIRDVRGLAATITHRLCAGWMRRQFPRRHALRNQIQYLLTRQAGFALWPDDKDEMKKLIAGFAAWKGQRPSTKAVSHSRLTQDERLLESLGRGEGSANLREALATIFNHIGGPVDFDELVKIVAALLQITERKIESVDADSDGARVELADQEADVAWLVEKRIFLQRLWEELRQLPLQQRVALLLNLRDHKGRGCIALFPATGVATIDQLAEALEMSAEQLAEMWNELPLEDAKIAELLHQTRQQIINARQSARRRLARRLKGFL